MQNVRYPVLCPDRFSPNLARGFGVFFSPAAILYHFPCVGVV